MRAITVEEGIRALTQWMDQGDHSPRSVRAMATRYTLQEFAALYPGHAVEVRVPPFGACQILTGTSHRRGTPPAVVEMDVATWLRLAMGILTWDQATEDGHVVASGQRTDLGELLPLPLPEIRRLRATDK